MKKLITLIMILGFIIPSMVRAADVNLCITVPDAWVGVTIAAINERWPKPDGITQKRWAETLLRSWLRNVVAAYKNEQDRISALDAGGYTGTADNDIPIDISPE